MANFTVPHHILIGTNVLEEAKPYFTSYGKRAFIVTGKHVVKSNMMIQLKEVLEECRIAYTVFDGITGEPTDQMIEEAVSLYKKENCEFCIGIGGGSPLDAAKAIAAMSVSSGKITDYIGKEMNIPLPPVAAIPTTAGTGSEATKFTIITDTKKDIKMLLKGDVLIPELAIVDYGFSVSTSKTVTAATGLDALTHAVEAYTSRKASPMTDTLAVSAVKRIMRYLPEAYRNGQDIKAREEMALAALEAGICINNSSVTIVHGMSRPIGALFHVPHGMSNAMLLKGCLEFVFDGARGRFADLARAVGAADDIMPEEEAALNFLDALGDICHICEIPTLREYGIEQEKFYQSIDKMAQDAVDSGSPGNTRKTVTAKDCRMLYKKIYG